MSGYPASSAQKRKIYALCNERGIDDDLLHEHIRAVCGIDSMKNMSIDEANRVIDSLEGHKSTSGNASYKQMKYIEGLMTRIGWVTESKEPDYARLTGLCRKMYGIESYKWLTIKMASGIIEAMKEFEKREREEKAL